MRHVPRQARRAERTSKAERTREAILEAAEDLFARRGYATTRLDDVAESLGMTGAALFYYFRDKAALYDAVMERAFGSLAANLSEVLFGSSPIVDRIEGAVVVWVDAMVARPTLARLILRHVADAEEHVEQSVYPGSEEFLQMTWSLFEQGRSSGELAPLHDNPFHAASAVIGATVFYVCALAPLCPPGSFDPLSEEEVAAHKRDALQTARHHLGIRTRKRPKKMRP